MKARMRVLAIFLALFVLYSLKVNAQCTTAYTYAVCPDFDTVYLFNIFDDPWSVAAFQLSNGQMKWEAHVSDGTLESSHAATADTLVFVVNRGNYPNTAKELQGWDTKTGKRLWRRAIPAETFDLASVGSHIFAGVKSPDGMLVFNDKTGTPEWEAPADNSGARSFYESNGSLLLTDLYAADADSGQVIKYWPKDWNVSTAAFAGNFVVVGTGSNKDEPVRLAAYSLPNYTQTWVKEAARRRYIAGLAGDADHVVVASYAGEDWIHQPGKVKVQVLASSTGKMLWQKTFQSESLSGDTSGQEVGISSGIVIVSTLTADRGSSSLQAFDVTSGRREWSLTLKNIYQGVTCLQGYCYLAGVRGKVLRVDVRTGEQHLFAIPRQ